MRPASNVKPPKSIPDSLRQQAIDWLLLIQSDQCNATERQAFNDWLAQNPAHQHAYATLKAQWEWMGQFKTSDFPARDAALRYRKKSKRSLFAYSAAASVLLAAGLTAFSPNGWYGSSETYQVAKGGKQSIELADGSTLELNTGSEARVHFNRWQRRVELLRGEAFFTVVHNPERPFEVHAGIGRIRDIGTAFEVYIQPQKVSVAVEEGVVEVQTSSKQTLSAGQHLSYNNRGEWQADTNTIASLTGWRQGKMVFRARRLDEVLAEMGRYHDTDIKLQNPTLAGLKVSGTFNTDKLDNSLNAIAAILPVKIEYISSREIILKLTKSR